MYEPFVAALSEHLLMPLPAWRAASSSRENWRTTPWGQAHEPSSEGWHADH
jgi:hypothetical protein